MANVIVTGGAGFIGSHLVDMMISEGHQVTVIDDLSTGTKDNLNQKASLKVLDICSPEAAIEIAKLQPEIIIHAAAQISVRVSMADPLFDAKINILGLVNILEAFKGKKLPYFMFLCTGGALYGEQLTFPATEDHPINPTSFYGLTKSLSEHYLKFWQNQFGLNYVSLRLANVYGPRQNCDGESGVVAIFCKSLLSEKAPIVNGTGEQTRDYIFVEDVVNAFRLAQRNRPTGSYNIGTGCETSVIDLLSSLNKALESNIAVNIAAQHGPVKSGEQLRSVISPNKALETFGWKPLIDLNSGLSKTASWFRENK